MKFVIALSLSILPLTGVTALANGGGFGGQPLMASDVTTLATDLDRDGLPETFEVKDNGESLTTLTIMRPGRPSIVAKDMVWSLELASLKLAPNGSVQLGSSHVGVGRSPHEQTLTIAYRANSYQVVGITRSEWDRHDTSRSTGCDINFVTGRSTGLRRVRPLIWLKPVTAWKWDSALPAGCFIP